MGILFVNPSRRSKKRLRVSGRAKVGRSSPKRSKKRRMPKALAAYWAKRRGKKSKSRRNPAKKKRGGSTKKRKSPMAKKKRRARRGKRRTKRRSSRRGRKRARGGTKRRARRRKGGGKRRRARRSTKRRGRRKKRRSPKRRARRRKSGGKRRRARRTKRKSGGKRRRRSVHTAKTVRMRHTPGGTLIMNPRRRRRRSKRRGSRRRGRRTARRYGRSHYRKNPGAMLLDLAKRAAPVLIGLYGARMLVKSIGPRIPGVSRLGAFQSPVLAIGAVLLTNFVTKKVGKLAKYRSELLLGTGLNALDALISAFAPASIKAMIGVGDVYDRALGEYLHAGEGSPAEDPSNAMGEYVQMGEYIAVDGVDEELGGVDEELGAVDEELGDQGSWGEGVSRDAMLRPVQRSAMLAPVPTKSYTRAVDPATEAWNNPRDFYQGIFAGGPQGSAWDPGE